MSPRGAVDYLVFIAGPIEIHDDLSDANHIIRLQGAFARYPHMIDECAICAVQIDDRELFLSFIRPDLGMVARGSGILQEDVIRDSPAQGCLSTPYFIRFGKTVGNVNDKIPHTQPFFASPMKRAVYQG